MLGAPLERGVWSRLNLYFLLQSSFKTLPLETTLVALESCRNQSWRGASGGKLLEKKRSSVWGHAQLCSHRTIPFYCSQTV